MTTLAASLATVTASHTPRPRILERNTFRYTRPDGAEVTRLHNTDIVTQHGDGRVTLNSGGWRTVTTKDRINTYASPYTVFSEKGVWYVQERGASSPRIAFYDGIVLPDAFNSPKAQHEATAAVKADSTIRKQIARYSKAIRELPVLPPGAGDCWFCMMHTQDGQALGDATGDNDHLREHLRETYVHGSLIVNALRDSMNDTGLWIAFNSKPNDSMRDLVAKRVARYFKRKLGMA